MAVETAPIQAADIEIKIANVQTPVIATGGTAPKSKPQPEPIALSRVITRDGSWEVINGERILEKKITRDPSIPGHTILEVRTFEPGTNKIKQSNNTMDTIHLFDNAQAYIQYAEPKYRAGTNGDKIAEFKTQYDEVTKEFIPIIVDKDNNTYIGKQIISFWLK